MEYAKFASAHAFARRNAYKGSYSEYVALQYKTYADGCRRMNVRPMSREQWEATQ